METLNYRMIQRKGKESDLPSNPRDGEIYITTDTNTMYFGSNGKINKVPTMNDVGSGTGSGGLTTINNTLTSTSTTEALSANMGNQLKITIDNHTKNNDIHVTSAEKAQWDAKASTTVASATTNGLMTSDDKIKLNSVAVGATNTVVNDTLTSSSTTEALSANMGKTLNNNLTSLSNIVTTHLDGIASKTTLGHVRVDGTTIKIDENGVISVVGGSSSGGNDNNSGGEGESGGSNEGSGDTSVKIYGVKIDTTNSNPETAVTYTDDAVGFTPARGNNGNFNYGSWEGKFPFNQIKPCVTKGLDVQYYLDSNDYSKKTDGTASTITSTTDGDVMVEFPKIWWKFERVGTDLYVRYANAKIDSTYKCLAHMRGTEERDKLYIGAYLSSVILNVLHSHSGTNITSSSNKPTVLGTRKYAKANTSYGDMMGYYQLVMLQVLYLVMFKSLDSQTALGRGNVDNTSEKNTGGANQKGLFFGENNGMSQLKFCGIEDFYGNATYFIDGLFIDSSRNILIGTRDFSSTGVGYNNLGQGATSNVSGYVKDVQGTTETGFMIKTGGASATTYYSDIGSMSASALPVFGGDTTSGSATGAFSLNINITGAYATSNSRLMFL